MIRILVDSSADYLQEELKEKNIELVPMTITIGEGTYVEGENLTRDEFYNILTTMETFPKTSQPSPQAFVDVFEKVKENKDEIICILLSSTLSGTFQSAVLAKNIVDYDGIHLIDSKTATACIRIMADYACKLREEGMCCEEIIKAVEDLKGRIHVYGVVDTLEYLYRGGRLNKATAAIGEMAKLKPMITVNEEGNVAIAGKCIGAVRAINHLMKTLEKTQIDTEFPFYTIYTYGEENCEKLEKKLVDANYTFVSRLQLGATLGTHLGTGAYGVVFVEKE